MPFDTSLGTLNAVRRCRPCVHADYSENVITNYTSSPQSFNLTDHITLITDAGYFEGGTRTPIPMTLAPMQSTPDDPSVVPGDIYQLQTSDRFNLGKYTNDIYQGSQHGTPQIFVNTGLSIDNPLLTINPEPFVFFTISGTERLVFYYGDTFPTPEPASLVMMSFGLAVVAGVTWRRHRAA